MIRPLKLLAAWVIPVAMLASTASAQTLYTDFGTTSAGLSLVAANAFGDDANDNPAVGLVLSGGFGGDIDVSLTVARTSGNLREVTSTALGAAVYVVKSNGLRIGPTIGLLRASDGRNSATAASIGALVAQQLTAGRGLMVPQATFTATAVNGGGVQTAAGVALAGVLGLGKARLVIEPALGLGFNEGAAATWSLTGGVVLSL